jgi:hypothetical protein
MSLSIDEVNTYAAKWTISGWFVGLAWFAYSNGLHSISWIGWAILIIGGMFAASLIIGFGVALLMGGITKLVYGKSEASSDFFAWGAFISPVIAFFCAGPIARLFT